MITAGKTYWHDSGNVMTEEVVLRVFGVVSYIPCPFDGSEVAVPTSSLFETPEEALTYVTGKLGRYEQYESGLQEQILERAEIEERAKEEQHFDDKVNEGRVV